MAFLATLVMGITLVLLVAITAYAQPSNSAKSTTKLGRHFILLIDDSASIIKDRDRRAAIKSTLPDLLFDDVTGAHPLKGFDPDIDRASVVFFTIYETVPGSCYGRVAKSASAENMFQLVRTGSFKNKQDFATRLNEWLYQPCRFNGNWSPIGIASLLVIPYLQSPIPKDELHSQTILIEVTDGRFNTLSPSHELIEFGRAGIAHIDETSALLGNVSSLFKLNVPAGWRKVENEVFYLRAEIKPQPLPQSVIQYQRDSLLYPQAVSSQALRYRLNDQIGGDIQILPAGKNAGYTFTPLWFQVQYQNEQGKPWQIGSHSLPAEAVQKDLTQCSPPLCEEKNGRYDISLFDGVVKGLRVSPSDSSPDSGRIDFRVGFHYHTPIYSHLCTETEELSINVDNAKPADIPNIFFPPSKLTKQDMVSEWASEGDGITTQEEAKNRLVASAKFRLLLGAIAAVILSILAAIYAFLKYYHRRFQPRLTWLAVPEIIVDFNRPAASRLLVGTLKVENDGRVPWLGRMWPFKNDEQPTRQAEISLNYSQLQGGLKMADGYPIGFVSGEKSLSRNGSLERLAQESVSHSKQIYIFLAADSILDYSSLDASASDAHFVIDVDVQMKWWRTGNPVRRQGSIFNHLQYWLHTHLLGNEQGVVDEKIQCHLTLKPEAPRKPLVTYQPVQKQKLYFRKGEAVEVGKFLFESQAIHSFAQPYEWAGYTIQTYQDNRPLSGEPIRLDKPRVMVPPYQTIAVPVYIDCDGQVIANPEPTDCEYHFKLIGDFDAKSNPGPYATRIYRDPTRAEIELKILPPKTPMEVYWTSKGTTKLRSLASGANVEPLLRDPTTINLEPQPIRFSARQSKVRDLFSIEVGNSGTAGKGLVKVAVAAQLVCDSTVLSGIHLTDGQPLDNLLGVYDFDQLQPYVAVAEGEKAQSRTVRIHPGYISRIVGGRIEADKIAAKITLTISVRSDQEKEFSERLLTVWLPLSLEQLPGANWLAIDFGTSAISAAWGTGRRDNVTLIPLQEIKVKGGKRSLSEHDPENAERGSRYLLPSWVGCDADLRGEAGGQADQVRPGFPSYYSKDISMMPGEPEFISLPAPHHLFESHPGRIIYSLKSWLGKASPGIFLGTEVPVRKNGKTVSTQILPLDKTIESGFAALAEAYLLPDYRADRIVICHPNTFTRRHQELLLEIVHRALGNPARFGIALAERIRLISESDAVAYYHCAEKMRGQPAGGTERILVYDFGAGTLDLSLIKVEWKQTPPRHPEQWTVEKRLGVPIAGNYLDEIMVQLIDRLLANKSIVNAQDFKYQFPVVTGQLIKDKSAQHSPSLAHRRAIINLWGWIREAKHSWSDACRKVLAEGRSWDDCPAFNVQVGFKGASEAVTCTNPTRTDWEQPKTEAGLWIKEDKNIYLSIPTRLIAEDKQMNEFIAFATDDLIDELLNAAQVSAGEVNTVLVSGRGALYPGLRDRIWQRFSFLPLESRPDLFADSAMKQAVVLGAIARQGLSRDFIDESAFEPRFGILINDSQDLVMEEDWDTPIDLTASQYFRVVQVNLMSPNPRTDMNSLRRHFYIDVDQPEYKREEYVEADNLLYVSKGSKDGKFVIYIGRYPLFTDIQVAETVTTPPWPVGNVLLG
jgi:hypothetical protein